MKKAAIVSIGNELLSGQTLDTNSSYICGQLFHLGFEVVSTRVVGDDIEHIVKMLAQASTEADIILVTGGLGPTDDDITRQAVSRFLEAELVLDESALQHIKDYFVGIGKDMPSRNEVQAYLPAGATSLSNPVGTAPGIAARKAEKLIFVMPGVPSEMKRMFQDHVLQWLSQSFDAQPFAVTKLHSFGLGESAIAERIGDMAVRGRNPLINFTVAAGIVTLHIIARAQTQAEAQALLEADKQILKEKLGSYIFGEDDQTLAEVVGMMLSEQNKTLATAESCTGGFVGKLITDIPGSSKFYKGGWVTYSNEMKIEQLGVDEELIKKYGAVSEEVASAMAKGAIDKSRADFAIAITGIAGPDGGTPQKPVGLVFTAICSQGNSTVVKNVYTRTRAHIRLRAAQNALNMLRMELMA